MPGSVVSTDLTRSRVSRVVTGFTKKEPTLRESGSEGSITIAFRLRIARTAALTSLIDAASVFSRPLVFKQAFSSGYLTEAPPFGVNRHETLVITKRPRSAALKRLERYANPHPSPLIATRFFVVRSTASTETTVSLISWP